MFLVLEKIKYTVLYIVLFLTLEVDVSVELPTYELHCGITNNQNVKAIYQYCSKKVLY